VGCDLQLNSDSKVDRCGVCGGDGSTCTENTSDDLVVGYRWEFGHRLTPCTATCDGGNQTQFLFNEIEPLVVGLVYCFHDWILDVITRSNNIPPVSSTICQRSTRDTEESVSRLFSKCDDEKGISLLLLLLLFLLLYHVRVCF
jgi:hypothetical protein